MSNKRTKKNKVNKLLLTNSKYPKGLTLSAMSNMTLNNKKLNYKLCDLLYKLMICKNAQKNTTQENANNKLNKKENELIDEIETVLNTSIKIQDLSIEGSPSKTENYLNASLPHSPKSYRHPILFMICLFASNLIEYEKYIPLFSKMLRKTELHIDSDYLTNEDEEVKNWNASYLPLSIPINNIQPKYPFELTPNKYILEKYSLGYNANISFLQAYVWLCVKTYGTIPNMQVIKLLSDIEPNGFKTIHLVKQFLPSEQRSSPSARSKSRSVSSKIVI